MSRTISLQEGGEHYSRQVWTQIRHELWISLALSAGLAAGTVAADVGGIKWLDFLATEGAGYSYQSILVLVAVVVIVIYYVSSMGKMRLR